MCTDASTQLDPISGKECTDEARCVKSGIYYVADLTKRGVAPVSFLGGDVKNLDTWFNGGINTSNGKWIRPRTLAELDLSLLSIIPDGQQVIRGIAYPTFRANDNSLRTLCYGNGESLSPTPQDNYLLSGPGFDLKTSAPINVKFNPGESSLPYLDLFGLKENGINQGRSMTMFGLMETQFAYSKWMNNVISALPLDQSYSRDVLSPSTGWPAKAAFISNYRSTDANNNTIYFHTPIYRKSSTVSGYNGVLDYVDYLSTSNKHTLYDEETYLYTCSVYKYIPIQ